MWNVTLYSNGNDKSGGCLEFWCNTKAEADYLVALKPFHAVALFVDKAELIVE